MHFFFINILIHLNWNISALTTHQLSTFNHYTSSGDFDTIITISAFKHQYRLSKSGNPNHWVGFYITASSSCTETHTHQPSSEGAYLPHSEREREHPHEYSEKEKYRSEVETERGKKEE